MEPIDEFFGSFEGGDYNIVKETKSKKKNIKKVKSTKLSAEIEESDDEPAGKVSKLLHGEDEAFAKFLENEDPNLLNVEDGDLDDSEAEADESDLDKKESEFVGDENDADDFDDADEPDDVVDQSLIRGVKKWTKLFESNSATIATCRSLMRAFVQVSSPMVAAYGSNASKLKIASGENHEADDLLLASIVDLAALHLKPTLNKLLGTKVADKRDMPYNSLPKWVNIATPLNKYFTSCSKIVEASLQQPLTYKILKHLLVMRNYLMCYPKVVNQVVKVVSECWADRSNHELEISSFLLLERIAKLDMEQYYQEIARKAFSAYLKKAAASSLETLPKIAFMQQCLVQLFALDINFTYKQAFDSLKSIVLLVKAVTIDKKKEMQPELCSWKTVHTLYLWVSLYGSIKNYGILSSLVYPIVETIKEIISYACGPRFYPLRFHCVDMLTMLAKSTGKFIPIFQHILDIFSQTDFNTRPKKLSVRPFNLSGTVRFSESDLTEKGFLDCITERMYRLILEVMNLHAYSIASPELFLMPIVHIRKFLKVCENREYCQKFKQLVEKMEESAQFIASERERVTFSVQDADEIKKWEQSMEKEGKSCISKFYKKFVEIEAKNKAAKNLSYSNSDNEMKSYKKQKKYFKTNHSMISKKKGKKKGAKNV